MINLLSYDAKKQIRAARLNVILFRYIIILGFSAAFLVLACVTTYFFINSGNKTPVGTSGNYSSLEEQVETMRTNFTTAKSILDQQVNYSDILTAIASNLPTGTALKSINLKDSVLGTPINLQILAHSADLETKIKENFQKSSIMFSNYSVQSTAPNLGSASDYGFLINVSITINKVAI